MSDRALIELATAAGIQVEWIDAEYRAQQVTPDSLRALLAAMGYAVTDEIQIRESLKQIVDDRLTIPGLMTGEMGKPIDLPPHFRPGMHYEICFEDGDRLNGRLNDQGSLPACDRIGYHRVQLAGEELTIAVAPPRCPNVQRLCGHSHAWGVGVQMYSLRRQGDSGIGDTQALEDLLGDISRLGGDAVGISPVHAMFPLAPDHYSPYSPSSRLFYNELYASPQSVLGEAAVRDAILRSGLFDEMRRLERLSLIDWPTSTRVKQRLLKQLYQDFLQRQTPVHQDFETFRQQGGEPLLQHCCFQVLQSRRSEAGDGWDWRHWPDRYRDPRQPDVMDFMQQEALEIGFHAFCQWLTTRCLQQAQQQARQSGMGIGIIADLAVGADPRGSQAWSQQDQLLHHVSVGAPPDILNRSGQNWGITALSPQGLRRFGFNAFIQMLRANLAFAGGLRIDHVIGLQRLWLIPPGAQAADGAYLHLPFQDLMRLVCLEAYRAEALIIGEDLGTVPPGFQTQLAKQGVLGTRVLYFEKSGEQFIPPDQWSKEAVATSTTHDLPSFRGWCSGKDIDWRERLGQWSPAYSDNARRQRAAERLNLQTSMVSMESAHTDELDNMVDFLAVTPSPLVLLPMEDAVGCDEQPNLPGPGDEHPNWRRRWSQPAHEMLQMPEVSARLSRLNRRRRQDDIA